MNDTHPLPRQTPGATSTASVPGCDEADALREAERVKSMAIRDVQGALDLANRLINERLPPRAMLRMLSARAHALSYANDFVQAVSDLSRAAQIAQANEMGDELGSILLVSVQPLARTGRLDDAEKAARQASEIFERTGQPLMRGKAEVNLGIVRRMRGKAAEAIACFGVAASLLESDPVAFSATQSNLAVALLELDRFDEAAAALSAAIARLRDAGRTHSAAIVIGNMADLLARTGQVDDALACFDEAREMLTSAGAAADCARLTAEEAEALFAVGACVKAVRLFRPAIEVLSGSGLIREHARALLGYGLSCLRLGELPTAGIALAESVALAERADAMLISAEARIGLAEHAMACGRMQEARSASTEAAIRLAERPARRGAALSTLASIELADGRPEEALRVIELACSMCSGRLPLPLRARLGHLRGLALRRSGQVAGALDELRSAAGLADLFRAAIRAEQLRTTYLESSQSLFLDLASVAMDALPVSQAGPLVFDAMERLRSRTLLDSIRGTSAASMAGGHSLVTSAEIAELNALYSSIGPTAADGSPEADRRRERLRDLEAGLESRRDRVGRAAARGQSGLIEPMAMAEAMAHIPANEAVIGFVPDGDSVSAQVLRRDGHHLVRGIVGQREVAAACRRFGLGLSRALASQGPPDGQDALLQQCRRITSMLFEPLRESLRDVEHFRLLTFGHLHSIPMHAALPDWAAETCMASYVPGVSVAFALARSSTPGIGEPTVAVVGFADDAAPEIELEAAAVACTYPNARALIGADASAAEVLDVIAVADIVHVACHAAFDPEFPMSSRLRLADRWITARELVGRIRPGSLVVLAGCNTGRQWTAGEDGFGISRAVLASGAGAVLSALWPLHDRTSRRMLMRVHEHLASRLKSDACIASQLPRAIDAAGRMAAADGEPFHHWASLCVSGAIV